MTIQAIKISVGPLLYCRDKRAVRDFYRQLATQPAVDTVYLGETVCSKRRELKPEEWLELGHMLDQAGKNVVLSSLALITAPSDLKQQQEWIASAPAHWLIEANDIGVVQICQQLGRPFVASPALNIYNAHTLALLLKQGMTRWVMPVELSRQWLAQITAQAEELGIRQQLDVEVTAWGHLPLSYSARCYTARAEGKKRDNCEVCCKQSPDGKLLTTQEDETLFVINGLQIQSGKACDLIGDLPSMAGLVDRIRISPQQPEQTLEAISRFAAAIEGNMPGKVTDNSSSNGYWHHLDGAARL